MPGPATNEDRWAMTYAVYKRRKARHYCSWHNLTRKDDLDAMSRDARRHREAIWNEGDCPVCELEDEEFEDGVIK